MSRRKDIDQLRGIAILLMVMVHSAATWAPTDASTTSILALVIAGLGGLAAPLFVTVGGWVTVQSSWTLRKALIRFAFLYAAQIAVNISAPQLFDPFSPGVLTLFALLYLTAPLWVRISENLQATLFFGVTLLTLNYVLLGNHDALDWDDRTYVGGIIEHVEHLLLTGTYPFLPWILFCLFGASLNNTKPSRRTLVLLGFVGIAVSAYFLYKSVQESIPFAQPSGEAMLTFFPANTAFLIAAITGVLLIWAMLENRSSVIGLHHLGRLSLSLYVLHFIPLSVFSDSDLNLYSASAVTIFYTLLWWPLSVVHQARIPQYSLENAMRNMTHQREEEGA
ncbi:MAG: acyltransferase family protein [Euryarchaeota archaeon]|nr:acyltransferase family protein [Euryarchaeota archaeon]